MLFVHGRSKYNNYNIQKVIMMAYNNDDIDRSLREGCEDMLRGDE